MVEVMFSIGLFHSTIRKEEKLIMEAAGKSGVEVKVFDIREQIFNPLNFPVDFNVALERSVSTVKGNYLIQFLEALNIPVINSSRISRLCEDKFLTSLCLQKAAIRTPKFALAFDLQGAEKAVEELGGYPVVIKPVLGSWGRLLAKVNDRDALEAIIEHKEVLGSPHQKPLYLQEYVRKPGRDIRLFIIGQEPLCAIYRESEHWITNTSRGAKAKNCPLNDDLIKISEQLVMAIGPGLLAVDIFETEDGLSVNEVNHTMEFRNSEEPTGVSISSAIVSYCMKVAGQP